MSIYNMLQTVGICLPPKCYEILMSQYISTMALRGLRVTCCKPIAYKLHAEIPDSAEEAQTNRCNLEGPLRSQNHTMYVFVCVNSMMALCLDRLFKRKSRLSSIQIEDIYPKPSFRFLVQKPQIPQTCGTSGPWGLERGELILNSSDVNSIDLRTGMVSATTTGSSCG